MHTGTGKTAQNVKQVVGLGRSGEKGVWVRLWVRLWVDGCVAGFRNVLKRERVNAGVSTARMTRPFRR